MSLVFISGSSDGLGLLAARLLVDWGHEVTLHARSAARAEDARRLVPEAKAVAIGDLLSIEETQRVAEQVNSLGRHDAVGASGTNREAESTDAPERGGLPCSSDEAGVMLVDRRNPIPVSTSG
jgi:NAD(P)-dependent dehydrogenase (short-subunit alcohol dehydrogenase family)